MLLLNVTLIDNEITTQLTFDDHNLNKCYASVECNIN